METLLLITILFGSWLFFAYAILLPNYRYNKRIQIFQLRDKLRELKFQKMISANAFDISENAICNGVRTLSFINVFDVLRISKWLSHDKTASEVLEKRNAIIENQKNNELNEINKSVTVLIAKTSIMNMVGWLPIFIPLLFLFVVVGSFAAKIINMSKGIAFNNSEAVNRDLNNISLG